jgi:anti-sigma B factor antagonist
MFEEPRPSNSVGRGRLNFGPDRSSDEAGGAMQSDDRSVPPEFRFGLSTSNFNGTHVVAIRGELDLHTVPELKRTLAELAELDSSYVIVDLTHAALVDSTSLSALLETARTLRATGGELVVSCRDRSIRKVFAITGVDQLIPMHASLEDAVRQALERRLDLAPGPEPPASPEAPAAARRAEAGSTAATPRS